MIKIIKNNYNGIRSINRTANKYGDLKIGNQK